MLQFVYKCKLVLIYFNKLYVNIKHANYYSSLLINGVTVYKHVSCWVKSNSTVICSATVIDYDRRQCCLSSVIVKSADMFCHLLLEPVTETFKPLVRYCIPPAFRHPSGAAH